MDLLALGLFAGSLFSLIVSLLFFILDMSLSLRAVQEELKSGNVSVRHSKRFGRFEDYFIAPEHWQSKRDSFFKRSGMPADFKEVPGYLTTRLIRPTTYS